MLSGVGVEKDAGRVYEKKWWERRTVGKRVNL